ncbi:unnamed protein product [Diamesa serratosioi]
MVVEVIGNVVLVDGVKTELSKVAKHKLLLAKILNPDILEHILKHLPVDDLLRASLVCYSWYHTIATSKMCMSNIKITYKLGYERRQNRQRIVNQDLKEMLDESIRKYEHIKIITSDEEVIKLGLSHSLNVIDIFENSNRKFKEIKISGIIFADNKEYDRFLTAIAPNVTVLLFRKLKIKKYVDDHVFDVNFPKLVGVDILHCESRIMVYTFNNCVNLNRFKYSNGARNVPSPSSFKRILKMNVNLKVFEVTAQDVCQSIFDEKTTSYACKLKVLSCSNFYNFDDYDSNLSFIHFLLSQSNSLEEIQLTDAADIDILQVLFNDMKALKKLAITHLNQYAKVPAFVAMKTSVHCPIQKIYMSGYIPCKAEMLLKILQSCPKLEKISADIVSEYIMDRVTTYCPLIKHIKYRSSHNSKFFKHRFFSCATEIADSSYHTYHEDGYTSDY